jgi:uncharacterized NAD-dependent epimerase/dehydratase family protein
MNPAARESSMWVSIALVSRPDREYIHPLGGVVPGRRSFPQSYGRCGSSEVVRALLNTSRRSWYSAGMAERSRATSEPPG